MAQASFSTLVKESAKSLTAILREASNIVSVTRSFVNNADYTQSKLTDLILEDNSSSSSSSYLTGVVLVVGVAAGGVAYAYNSAEYPKVKTTIDGWINTVKGYFPSSNSVENTTK